MEALDKPRPALAIGLVAIAGFIAWRAFLQYQAASWHPAGHPWIAFAHALNVLAVCALATRFARPQWKKTAMVVALLAALLAFVLGQKAG
jgi:hypothetical protein